MSKSADPENVWLSFLFSFSRSSSGEVRIRVPLYFRKGNPPPQKKCKRALLGDLVLNKSLDNGTCKKHTQLHISVSSKIGGDPLVSLKIPYLE